MPITPSLKIVGRAHLQRGAYILDQAIFDEHVGLELVVGVDHRTTLSHQIAQRGIGDPGTAKWG